MRESVIRLLERRTGTKLATWIARMRRQKFANEAALTEWLTKQGVTGYPRMFLVMEQFGYPEYMLASSDELIAAQYADRLPLRPIYDAVVREVAKLEGATVQARKTFVSLVAPRRTFARIQATTRDRVDLGMRLAEVKLGGRLRSPRIHDTLTVEVGLRQVNEFDREIRELLRRAYRENS